MTTNSRRSWREKRTKKIGERSGEVAEGGVEEDKEGRQVKKAMDEKTHLLKGSTKNG